MRRVSRIERRRRAGRRPWRGSSARSPAGAQDPGWTGAPCPRRSGRRLHTLAVKAWKGCSGSPNFVERQRLHVVFQVGRVARRVAERANAPSCDGDIVIGPVRRHAYSAPISALPSSFVARSLSVSASSPCRPAELQMILQVLADARQRRARRRCRARCRTRRCRCRTAAGAAASRSRRRRGRLPRARRRDSLTPRAAIARRR